MHDMAVFWLRLATALYGVGLLHVMAVLLRRKAGFLKPALFAFLVGAVLHFVAIVEMATAIGHLPVDNFFESVTVCAFLIAVLFLFVYWRYDAASLSVCIFPLVFVMAQVGAMETPIVLASTNVRALLLIHVMMVLLGYAALLLTAVASVFYLIQERQLKRKKIARPVQAPAATRHTGQPHHQRDGLRLRVHHPGSDCRQHLGVPGFRPRLDPRAAHRAGVYHLGLLFDHGLPAGNRRLERP